LIPVLSVAKLLGVNVVVVLDELLSVELGESVAVNPDDGYAAFEKFQVIGTPD